MSEIERISKKILKDESRLFDELDEGGNMLTKNDINTIHGLITRQYGITKVTQDSKIDSILNSISYCDNHNKLYKAAMLFQNIISMHPFMDGNKRTALLSALTYLSINGISLNLPTDSKSFIYNIASRENSTELLEEIESWFRSHKA